MTFEQNSMHGTTPAANFPKMNRLRKSPEFKAVFDARNVASDGVLLVFALPNELGRSRLGLSVSRKVGNAVVRNRWKRLIREAFRRNKHEISRNVDLVIIPQRGAELPTQQHVDKSLVQSVRRILRRMKK